jgi:beta-1,4-mannosyl-glycoprotein beta-1,4-N-acetylglucosaminyltransferase
MSKVIDCFMFFNEIPMLNFRLDYLKDFVDQFVCVEATSTFSGKSKSINSESFQNISNFHTHLVHLPQYVEPVQDGYWPTENQHWCKERYQRNKILEKLNEMNLSDDDIILVHDVDEIPDRNTIVELRKTNFDICCLKKSIYYYNICCKHKMFCNVGKAVRYGFLKNTVKEVNHLRWWHGRSNDNMVIEKGGWHFSYFGDIEFIKTKIGNFSHQELNNQMVINDSKIFDCIKGCKNLVQEEDDSFYFIETHKNDYLPENWEKHKELFLPEVS